MRKNAKVGSLALLLGVMVVGGMIPGCGGGGEAPEVETDMGDYVAPRFKGAPQWVITGRGSDPDVIYGTGSVSPVADISLARDTAMGRARNNIVLYLQAEVRSLLESGQIQTDDGEAISSAQEISNTIAQVGDLDLSGAQMESSWLSSNNEYWVLAALDMEAFGNALERVTRLNERAREQISQRVRENHDRLDERTLD